MSKADMAPKPHGNKKAPATPNVQKHAQPVDQAGAPPINYAEVQAEEVEVLQAIFMEDYEEVETKSAWSKTTDLRFKLKLRAYSDAESFVVLTAQLTATYPKSAPLLEISSNACATTIQSSQNGNDRGGIGARTY